MMICVEFLTLSWQTEGLSAQINALDGIMHAHFYLHFSP